MKLEPTEEQMAVIAEARGFDDPVMARAMWAVIAPMVLEAAAERLDEMNETVSTSECAQVIRAMKGTP